ncbi:MAG: KipI family sensor histidine kinase inhibitor [Paraglaciecola psychrophila]|jgi:KipI family sensor histidine kinase inhibitor
MTPPPVALVKIEVAAENALIVYLGEVANADVSAAIFYLSEALKKHLGAAIISLIPSYTSLLISYDLGHSNAAEVTAAVHKIIATAPLHTAVASRLVVLPVYYGADVALDLASLATAKGLSVAQVITIHQQCEYRVYAIGFAPGFAYLGDVDQRIAAPRLATPRQRVPRGAVAIAERQTAVYPSESPGGWNIIGRCPVPMFDPLSTPAMPVVVGDRVQFQAIGVEKFLALGGVL